METDDEQVEKLKKWWQENGRSVVAGVIIGVGGLFGYRYWIDYQNDQAEQASQYFDQMVEAIDASQNDEAIGYAENLLVDFSGTDYAIMARFALARIYVESGDFEKAGEQLRQVVGTADNQPLGFVARKRLAAVQLQMSNADEALSTLSVDFPDEFSAGIEELKGDIYSEPGNKADAAKAYRKALNATPGPVDRRFLQQKLDNLGLTG